MVDPKEIPDELIDALFVNYQKLDDLLGNMPDFVKRFLELGKDVPLEVAYKKGLQTPPSKRERVGVLTT